MFILLSKDGIAFLIQAYSPISQFYNRVHEGNKYAKKYVHQLLILVLTPKFMM
jgi:hypothetical protein